jgi:hypothetical protein
MSFQCVSCGREVFNDGSDRRPPWCPSCGGNLATLTPVGAAAAQTGQTWPRVHEPAPLASGALALADTVHVPADQERQPLQLDELGEPERVFHGSILGRLACWFGCLACFGLAGAIAFGVLHQPNKSLQAGLGLVAVFTIGGFACVYMALTLGELSYLVFRDALVWRRGNDAKVIAWNQVRDIFQTVHPAWKKYRIVASKGVDLTLNENVSNAQALGEMIEEKVTAERLPSSVADLEEGRTVRFGPLGVNRAGLCFDGESAGWGEVSLSLGLNHEPVMGSMVSNLVHLHVYSPARTKADKVELGKIPNFRLFTELVRHVAPQCLPPDV